VQTPDGRPELTDPPTTAIPPVDLEFETAADHGAAWRAVTDPELVARWFTEASPLGEIGTTYRLDFGEGSVVTGEVLELEPGRRFTHGWAWADADAAEATVVTWSVEPLPGDGSRVRLLHDGWAEAGLGNRERDDHERSWAGYLDDLRDLLEGA
jgi:uncharacterized protein YndB with AHSA1/START domain